MERWKNFKPRGKEVEYPGCRKKIKAILAQEIMTLEEIANNPPSQGMKRQARKMWRERYATKPVELQEKAEPVAYDTNEKGWWKIEFAIDSYRGMGRLEEVREKAKVKAIDLLQKYAEGRIPFERVFHLRAQVVPPHRKRPISSNMN